MDVTVTAFNIRATLVRGRRGHFSETARSGPGHREARGHRGDDGTLAVFGRSLADDVAKRARERAQAVEADVQADVGHAPLGLAQQEHGALDAAALQVAMRGLAEGVLEGSD